jgi:mono/diheme cytochrome c family protein
MTLGWLFLVAPIAGAQAPGGTPTRGRVDAEQATAAVVGNAANGKALFAAHQCWACHGYNGETGTRLLQENGTFVRRLQTVEGFVSFIRAPRPDQAPPAGSMVTMPSYGVTSLSDRQAADLLAYIKTFKPTTPPVRDIPLLNQMLNEGGKSRK